jgi:hypothetical protein
MDSQTRAGLEKRGILPFRTGTRQRRAKVGALAYAANSTVSQVMNRVGYLARLIVQFRGTVTLSGAGALADLGPWSLVQRFRVSTNIGAAVIVDASGFGAFVANRQQRYAQDFGQAGMGQTVASADIHAAPVAMGANTWALSWALPISTNAGREFEFGLINCQSPETQVQLDIQTGALTDGATLVTGIVGNFHVYVEYYEVPQPSQFAQPPLSLCRLLEEQLPVGQVGDNVYTVPRMGVLLQAQCLLRANGARSDGFDSHAVRFNKTDTPYVQERQLSRIIDRSQYGLNPITGLFAADFYYAVEEVGQGDTRDAIDTEELATVEVVCTVSAGTALGANNNFLNVIRRIAQRLDR